MADPNDISWVKDIVDLSASATAFEPSRGIHCDVGGTATIRLSVSQRTVTRTLTAGFLYPYGIDKFTAGTATIAALY